MTSILQRAKVIETGMRRPLRVNIETISTTADPIPSGFGFSKEYALTATVQQVFWANDAQYNEAVKAAKKALNHSLYADSLSCIARLRSAIMGDDTTEALRILDELQRSVGL